MGNENTNSGAMKYFGTTSAKVPEVSVTVVDDPHFGESAAQTIERCRLETEKRNAEVATSRRRRLSPI